MKCSLCNFKCKTGSCINSHVKAEHIGEANPGYSIDIHSSEAKKSRRDEKHAVRSENCNVKESSSKRLDSQNRSIESQRRKAKKAKLSKVRRRIVSSDSDTEDEASKETMKSTPKQTIDNNIEASEDTTKVVNDSETIPKKLIKTDARKEAQPKQGRQSSVVTNDNPAYSDDNVDSGVDDGLSTTSDDNGYDNNGLITTSSSEPTATDVTLSNKKGKSTAGLKIKNSHVKEKTKNDVKKQENKAVDTSETVEMFEDDSDYYHTDEETEIDESFWNEDDSEKRTEIKKEATEEIVHVEVNIPQEVIVEEITIDDSESEDEEVEEEDDEASTSSGKRKSKSEGESSKSNKRIKEEEPENPFNLENTMFSFLSTLSTPMLRNWIAVELHDAVPKAKNKSIEDAIVLAGFRNQDNCDRRKITLCNGTGSAKEVDQSLNRCAELLDVRTAEYQMGNVSFLGVPELLKRRIWKYLAESRNRVKMEFRSQKHKKILLTCTILAKLCEDMEQ